MGREIKITMHAASIVAPPRRRAYARTPDRSIPLIRIQIFQDQIWDLIFSRFQTERGIMSRHWWTWVAYGAILAILVGGHIPWFLATRDPAIATRLGAAMTGLGIVVTARPYFRTGLRATVDRQLPGRLSPHSSTELLEQQAAEHDIARPGIVHDVVAERIVGVGLILFGALSNGYADLPLRWMGYAVK
jgi:hypothetical protein